MAQVKLSGIKTAHLEAAGEGTPATDGRAVVFRNMRGSELTRWWLKTDKEAESNLRMFRAALKYDTARV